MPTVSIILPTYNGSTSIAAAIESVLSQTYADWELFIIDDGSTDQTKLVVEQYPRQDARIIFIENERNFGIQKTLNRGIALAQGKYIARIDDDDQWIESTKLEKQVAYLEADSHCVLIGSNAIIKDEQGRLLGSYALPISDESIRSRMLFKNCFLHPTIMARKSAIDQAGGYDETETVKHVEDYALWLKLGQMGTFFNLPEVMTELIIHANSLTFQNRIIQAKRVRSLIHLYKNQYPNFYAANFVLWLRIAGFTIIRYVPIPQKFLYWIQRTYKKL